MAQRSSTMEERLFFSYNGKRVGEWADGHLIGHFKASTPQQCRDMCLANKQCRYWDWTVPGRYRVAPDVDESCTHLVGIIRAEPGQGDPGNYAGRVTDRPSTAGSSPAPSPTVPASGQLFPQPQPNMELIFRVPAPASNPTVERYAAFRFNSIQGDGVNVHRRAWEGPINVQGAPKGASEHVVFIFDEVPGQIGQTTCTISATPQQLRTVAVGAKLSYSRNCNSIWHDRSSRSSSQVERVVLRTERITVPIGTFDTLVVKRTSRTVHSSFNESGQLIITETSESELTRWWAPSLGFYVREQARNRVADRAYSQLGIDLANQHNEPLLPKSTGWFDSPPMEAVLKR